MYFDKNNLKYSLQPRIRCWRASVKLFDSLYFENITIKSPMESRSLAGAGGLPRSRPQPRANEFPHPSQPPACRFPRPSQPPVGGPPGRARSLVPQGQRPPALCHHYWSRLLSRAAGTRCPPLLELPHRHHWSSRRTARSYWSGGGQRCRGTGSSRRSCLRGRRIPTCC
jgi:hypothetical protein